MINDLALQAWAQFPSHTRIEGMSVGLEFKIQAPKTSEALLFVTNHHTILYLFGIGFYNKSSNKQIFK